MKMENLIQKEHREIMKKSTDFYARQGLRTLVFGQKIFDESVYQEWDRRYREAEKQLDFDRDKRLNKLIQEIENDFEYLGVNYFLTVLGFSSGRLAIGRCGEES